MKVLGIDLGATKLASAVFSMSGEILKREVAIIKNLKGKEIGHAIKDLIRNHIIDAGQQGNDICSIGISVPGIFNPGKGTVWAPNIDGWDNFPLLEEAKSTAGGIPVSIESDRVCSLFGELWKGNAGDCRNLVFIAVGTGIGAGILADGEIIRGNDDIAGAIGWMALDRPFHEKYAPCGCFEYFASGDGLARVAKEYIANDPLYKGVLKELPSENITSYEVFSAFELNDPLAKKVINLATECWGMAVANIVSLLNPEKVILGGGLFGPAAKFIPDIIKEARKWAQPVAMERTEISVSALGTDAGIYGAGYLAIRKMNKK